MQPIRLDQKISLAHQYFAERGELDLYLDWFQALTSQYASWQDQPNSLHTMKLEHSYRVLECAMSLANSLQSPPAWKKLLLISALFHDVGRFPQIAQYETLCDRLSMDHAKMSVKVLRDNNVLRKLSAAEARLVLGAISLHNKMEVPRAVRPALEWLAKALRDSDKLDIIRVAASRIVPNQPIDSGTFLHLSPPLECFSPEVVEQVAARQMVRMDTLKWIGDYVLMVAAWIYDINFAETAVILRKRGHMHQLLKNASLADVHPWLAKRLIHDLERAAESRN